MQFLVKNREVLVVEDEDVQTWVLDLRCVAGIKKTMK